MQILKVIFDVTAVSEVNEVYLPLGWIWCHLPEWLKVVKLIDRSILI